MDYQEKIIDREVIREHLVGIQPPEELNPERKSQLVRQIKLLLKEKDAALVAHYYVDDSLQSLAEESGGFVGDSLEMAKFGSSTDASTLVVAGVKFMGETAKIINPEKTVLMPTLEATCSLDLSCPADKFEEFCKQHPDRVPVVYANTSAKVKSIAEWVVTSSIAVDVIEHLHGQGKKIIWAPDKHLGRYLQQESGADMLLWDGACIVHEEFQAKGLEEMKSVYPDAGILAHPESPQSVLELADVVGSTSKLIQASRQLDNKLFIVATDKGIFHKMRMEAPGKEFIPAPTAGNGATCRSCAHCPWMAMNSLQLVENSLIHNQGEIEIPAEIIAQAKASIQRMMNFREESAAYS
ncbi:MAG: quinolinate synthase NadA [Gammaproteobacteria bacterium]|nr:quinolinate synthase NadA [Gammaproteobacteria bacterium]